MTNPTSITWTDPATNTDGSPLAAGEITGYSVGVRSNTAAGSAAGAYPYTASAPSTSTSELLSGLSSILPPDTYVAAVGATTANGGSAWSAESAPFAIGAPTPTPNPPTSVQVS
jgi:hypothetical protein